MKSGFSLLFWMMQVTEAHLPLCADLRAIGYDGVEIPVTGMPEPGAQRLGRQVADLGPAVTASGGIPDPSVDPTDPASHLAGVDHLRRLVDLAVAMGAEVLSGPFTQPLARFSGTGPTAGELALLAAAHRAMADHAGRSLQLAVEPLNRFECYALNTAAQVAALGAAVGRSNYGWLYDTFHANIEERDPIGALALGPAYVHLSENDRGTPGPGHIDFAGTLAALRAQGCDGWLVVEAFGQALPTLPLRRASGARSSPTNPRSAAALWT